MAETKTTQESNDARAFGDYIFEKYATKEEKKEYNRLYNSWGWARVEDQPKYLGWKDIKIQVIRKNYDKAKEEYIKDQNKKAQKKKEEAKQKTDYEEWKAKQPKLDGDIQDEKGWFSRNKQLLAELGAGIVGIGALVGGVAALTPTVMNLLNQVKDKLKHKSPEPTPEEKEEIAKNPRSVSLKMYSFIRDSEQFLPYVKQDGLVVKIGFGSIVNSNSEYSVSYPYRSDSSIIDEYFSHVKDETINDWLKTVIPALLPLDMAYALFDRDIKNIENIINKELTDVVLEQYEFDALASFLWTMRAEGTMYTEFKPENLIKEIHTLLFYDTRENVAKYMKEVDKRLVLDAKVWNRRTAETSLLLTGIYEVLSYESPEKTSYDDIFSDMKNEYVSRKTGDENLKKFSDFVGNDTLESARISADKKMIKRDNKDKVSANQILGTDIVSHMVYPVLGKGANRGGKENTGIVDVDYICYGWFGSERGEGQGIHYGVDLLCDKNNPIIMPYSGTIEKIGVATNKDNNLKRVVIRPDYNPEIVVSVYYLKDIKVSVNEHYDAGTLLGTVGDCSTLFEYARLPEGLSPFDYIHVQFNETNENGIPLNPTSAITKAVEGMLPEELDWLLNHPVVYDFEAGIKTIQLKYSGNYEIVLVGSGGNDISGTLDFISEPPVELDKITPYKYSVTGSQGAYIKVQKYLEVGTYEYSLGDSDTTTSFDSDLICDCGLSAFFTNNEDDKNESASYYIPDDYTIIESVKGSTSNTVQNVCGYDIITGEPLKFTILSGLDDIYKNEALEFSPNTWYEKGENCKCNDLYFSAKNKFKSGDEFDVNDWNKSFGGFGCGGEVGLNGGSHLSPTPSLIYIKYLGWN